MLALLYEPVVPGTTFVEWLSAWGHLETGIDLLTRMGALAPELNRRQLDNVRAAFLRQLGRLADAERMLEEVVCSLTGTIVPGDPRRQSILATAYVNRANVQWQLSRFSNAVADYDRALNLLEKLLLTGHATLEDVINARMNRGHAQYDLGNLEAALRDQEWAAELSRHLAGNDGRFQTQLAAALSRIGLIKASLREFDTAATASAEAIAIYRELVAAGRDEHSVRLANELINQASVLAEADRTTDAEAPIAEGVEIAETLVSHGRSELESLMARARMVAAHVWTLLGRPEDGCREAELAIAVFSRLARSGRRDVRGWLAHSLFNRAFARWRAAAGDLALQDFDEARQLSALLIDEGEFDMRIVRLKKATLAARNIPLEKSVPLLSESLEEAFRFLADGCESDHLRLELRISYLRLETDIRSLTEAGLSSALALQWRGLAVGS